MVGISFWRRQIPCAMGHNLSPRPKATIGDGGWHRVDVELYLSWHVAVLGKAPAATQPHISDALSCQPQHCCHHVATETGRGADLAAKHPREGKKKEGDFNVHRHYCQQKGACRKTCILGKRLKLPFLLEAV